MLACPLSGQWTLCFSGSDPKKALTTSWRLECSRYSVRSLLWSAMGVNYSLLPRNVLLNPSERPRISEGLGISWLSSCREHGRARWLRTRRIHLRPWRGKKTLGVHMHETGEGRCMGWSPFPRSPGVKEDWLTLIIAAIELSSYCSYWCIFLSCSLTNDSLKGRTLS